MDFMNRDQDHLLYKEQRIVSVVDNSLDVVPPLIPPEPFDFKFYSGEL